MTRRGRRSCETRRRQHMAGTRLDDTEHATVVAAAAALGMTLGSYLRHAALKVAQ